jgi:biopolymer transport protein ExbD
MKRRKLRTYRKGRIEIIPMIDVMFFLLATFMLASLSMQNLDSIQVNLPQGQAEKLKAEQPLILTLATVMAPF